MNSRLPDILLHLVQKDGYSVGETSIMHDDQLCACIDASKDDHRWCIIASDQYAAVVELMLQLGWDLEDG